MDLCLSIKNQLGILILVQNVLGPWLGDTIRMKSKANAPQCQAQGGGVGVGHFDIY